MRACVSIYLVSSYSGPGMVLILDDKSEIGAHVRSNLCYLICGRHLLSSSAVTTRNFFSGNPYFPSCVRYLF